MEVSPNVVYLAWLGHSTYLAYRRVRFLNVLHIVRGHYLGLKNASKIRVGYLP